MSRSIPLDVAAQMQPVSSDFNPTFQDKVTHVRWAATLDVTGSGPLDVELGYSRAGASADESKERANLRVSAWQAKELARLGRRDLLGYCSVTRFRPNQ